MVELPVANPPESTPNLVMHESRAGSVSPAGWDAFVRACGGSFLGSWPVVRANRFFNRVRIFEYQPTMMHTKALIVDGIWSMFGSANFDNRSLELNDELNVGVSSRELAGRLLQDFDKDLAASRKLELTTWRQRSFLMKTRENFWSHFAEVF